MCGEYFGAARGVSIRARSSEVVSDAVKIGSVTASSSHLIVNAADGVEINRLRQFVGPHSRTTLLGGSSLR